MRKIVLGVLPVLVAAVLVAVGVVLVNQILNQDAGPVYSVSQVEDGLNKQPEHWLGRTIRLKALVLRIPLLCSGSISKICETSYVLLDYPTAPPFSGNRAGDSLTTSLLNGFVSNGQSLTLHPEPDGLLSAIRKVPGLASLLSRPQRVFGFGTYRIIIRPAPTSYYCPRQPCYWAVLPDAGPVPQIGSPLGLYQ